MTASFLDYFKTNKHDNKVIIKDSLKTYTVREVKELAKVGIVGDDNFSHLINYLNRFLYCQEPLELFTSGTTGERKCVKKSLQNLLDESYDVFGEFKLEKNLEFITTVSLKHLFGISFAFMLPLNNGCVINTNRINYPEDINIKNAVLVTTPSFLETMRKYNIIPPVAPKVIISAGAKLENETFMYARKIAEKVFDVYGSTETGAIAYRNSQKAFWYYLFGGIKILSHLKDGTKISSKYSFSDYDVIGDIMGRRRHKIVLLGRSDRILKIQEIRISAVEMEKKFRRSRLVKDSYCFEYNSKIAALVVLSETGIEFLQKNGKLETIKKLKSFASTKFEVVPQKWNFIDEIPKNGMGKIDREGIIEIFNINLSYPFIFSKKVNQDSAIFELSFLSSSNFFKGHFEGFPILPGVVQLFYANYFTKIAFNIDCHCGQIRKVKFVNIIKPDVKVYLELKKISSGVEYRYFNESGNFSSGILPLKNYYKE